MFQINFLWTSHMCFYRTFQIERSLTNIYFLVLLVIHSSVEICLINMSNTVPADVCCEILVPYFAISHQPLSIKACVTSVWNRSHSNAAAARLGFHRGSLEMYKISISFHRTEFHSLAELNSDIEMFNDFYLTSWYQPEIIQNFMLALHA